MEKRELRLGDWVKCGWVVGRVDELHEESVILTFSGGSCNMPYDTMKPVELNETLLERNGFVYREHLVGQWILEDEEGDQYVSLQPRDGGYHVRIRGIWKKLRLWPIKYLHELQNAMEDCGVSLTDFIVE